MIFWKIKEIESSNLIIFTVITVLILIYLATYGLLIMSLAECYGVTVFDLYFTSLLTCMHYFVL